MLTQTEEKLSAILPISIYDIEVSSADGRQKDILSKSKGKVTLLFNVAAGCGNIPQHSVLEELNQIYKNEPDFSILAVVVDDFVCHGYPEFQGGLKSYVETNNLELTPAQVAEKYARDNFGVTYDFTELTNGRYDKHTYDDKFLPNSKKQQEIHPLWFYLTGCHEADFMDNGVPYTNELVPWSYAQPIDITGKRTQTPLMGNFTKFLIDKTGTKIIRYANGFLLGERDMDGNCFPWVQEKYKEDGRRDHNPITVLRGEKTAGDEHFDSDNGPWPTKNQRYGIEMSLEMISQDINYFLGL